ncbi:ATP-dependent RNA helicase DHX30-like [Nylanderia fulva]|uniref:ATP-dependent RNA helicase DHX30-like n=1 Tax=Nylanderia fulva TaxID=613905 RepID=UPI0010FB44D3|nr:ATP-dependent RNA helicase DHX30-like [Nylanderia fulva]XP_029167796.1 ATP-dependent RNA helicase DHX30-like [Nylanderia fulva]XP_029167797.1 ATP-dependent RNA helicase DHX30-like [Nylanderia fulva]XP_029167798.1 ATP-dependent RNA helicase DHX30-like [Nylanderia fulva]
MSGTFLILAGQRSAYKWLKRCHTSFLYKDVIKDSHVHHAAQYCIFVKDKENKRLSKEDKGLKDFKYENVANANNLHSNLKLGEQISNKLGKNYDQIEQRSNKEPLNQKKLERLYPDPKSSVTSIYSIISHELKDPTVLTSKFEDVTLKETKVFWQNILNVKWPEAMSFKGIGKTKRIASKIAALKCLQWLEMNDKLKNGKPVIYAKEDMKNINLKSVDLSVTSELLHKMTELIETYETKIRNMTTREDTTATYNLLHQTSDHHPILGQTFYTDTHHRNETLRQRLFEKESDRAVNLPIIEFRDEILSKLKNNRVLLIEGDTGCGKTTQVPQFIMDNFASSGNATDCNILVSQPRRISAISLADRIAHERGEKVGDVVGFQVRLEQVLPKELGGILFCTTGILLRKLQSNPSLEGCSHVILDEAHERHIDTDMLMILLKRALEQNPDLKVLIMSATINAHMFQQYFDCPAVKVPGRLYPVKMHFLDDIEKLPNIKTFRSYNNFELRNNEDERLLVDLNKIVQIIKWISHKKPPGAILCFLPGWNEITKVQSMLEDISFKTEELLILPIHSKVSHGEQRKIFEHTPPGMRKIILATDIAETGITVSDVVYVIDSAIRKESRWDNNKDVLCISNNWISKANINQRKGRAGRVKPGESYHIITKSQYAKLEPHPLPQVLCNPLEKVVLDTKSYTNEKAKKFLSNLLEPPNPVAIQKAVNNLIDLGVLDDQENLTALGKRMALFPMHPKFSKALVYSSIFNCIHPVITIAGVFSGENNLFYGVLDHKSEIRENKKLYHPSSDHISMAWIFKQWFKHNTTSSQLMLRFCKQMRLRQNRMEILSQIRNTFIQHLIQCRLLSKNTTYSDCDNFDDVMNKYENNDELVRALLYSATQQLIEQKNVGFKKGVLRKGVNRLQTQGRAIAVISGESVNYKRKVWPTSYLTYFNGAYCEMRRSIVVRETSMISPLSVLLFSQGEIQCYEKNNDNIEIVIKVNQRHTLRFSCNRKTADVLLEFRNIMWSLVQYSLEKQGVSEYGGDLNSKQIFEYKNQLLETVSEILHVSSKPIEKADESSVA